jgi:hypothetical protein
MVIAKRKPIEEIIEIIKPYNSILLVGCAGCTAVCLAGGMREVNELKHDLSKELKKDYGTITVERQCEMDFLEDIDHLKDRYEAVLSLACGAGVQLMAERYRRKPVFPALNTVSIGVNRAIGWYEENCKACGDCQLAYTGGICPVTSCAKSIFNGPCGGSENGRCEVDKDIPCAWCEIYERLKIQNRLENILSIKAPVQWKNQIRSTVVQPGFEGRVSDAE